MLDRRHGGGEPVGFARVHQFQRERHVLQNGSPREQVGVLENIGNVPAAMAGERKDSRGFVRRMFERFRIFGRRRRINVNPYRSGLRLIQPGDEPEQRRFPTAGRAENCQEFAGRNIQINSIKRNDIIVEDPAHAAKAQAGGVGRWTRFKALHFRDGLLIVRLPLGQIDCVDVRDAQDNRLGTRPTGSESKDEIDFLINRAIDIISQSTTIIRTATVEITPAARGQISVLPLPIQVRVFAVIERLVNWPNASGARPLRAKLKGNFRIRTGDYRVIFHYTKPVDTVTVWKIGYRGDIYD